MSSSAPHLPSYGRGWLRALVLLLALLVPGAHAEIHAAPAVAASGGTVEYDVVLDTALRPPARAAAHRPAVPPRPAPLQDPAPEAAESRAGLAPVETSCAPHATLRTVVLRC
ncbi:hypothetical protein [Streptomyces sp. NPDC002088]|uniref:hypothetical protein n=1 Tax=Streptomyces sp. NPDC002088 TaxID=3154665 RepID=UPI00331B829E